MLIWDVAHEGASRIVDLDPTTGLAWLYRVQEDGWPYPILQETLLDAIQMPEGDFRVCLDDPLRQVFSDTSLLDGALLTATDKRHMESWELIRPLVTGDNARALLTKATRAPLISARLKEVTCTRPTIVSTLRRWWARGMTYQAIRPDFRNCGGPGKTRVATEHKLGRRSLNSSETGVLINDEIRRWFHVGADYYFHTKCTREQALLHIIDVFVADGSTDSVDRPDVRIDDSRIPTLRQFDHFIRVFYSYSRRYRGVHGEKAWNLQGRPTLGDAKGDVPGPGDRYFIDATIANVYLRSQLARQRIVGRPVVYLVVDAYSDMVVGFYAGFEGPSWIGAMMALVNVVTPKVEFCRQFGVDITSDEWPCHHFGRVLQGDSGELKYKLAGQKITRNLGVEIDNTPVGRPDLQAPVERRFGTIPATFREFTPGYVEPDFGERGGSDYRVEARLTLREFTAILIYAILDHNYRPVESKPIPPEMITAGMVGSPLDFWEWGIANRSGTLTLATIDEVALSVLCEGLARVTRKGIRFEGEYYSCDSAHREEWFAKARGRGWSVSITYDPRDLGFFYLRDTSLQGGYEICRPRNPNSDRIGTSLVEVRELNRERKAILAATAKDRLRRRIRYRRAAAAIERQAVAKTEAALDPKLSKNEQVALIRQNRAAEKSAQRERESLLFRPDPPQRLDDGHGPADADEAMTQFEQDALAILREHHHGRKRSEQDDNT
jgi:hypothetical protein